MKGKGGKHYPPVMGLRQQYRYAMGPVHGAVYDLEKGEIHRVFAPLSTALADLLRGSRSVPQSALLALRLAPWSTEQQAEMIAEPFLQPDSQPQRGMVWIELTGRCNYRCIHCYAESGPDLCAIIPDGRIFELIREVAEGGWQTLQFTGGDPTAHPRLMEFVRYAHSLSIPVIEVYTNGANLRSPWLDEMKELGTRLAISFYAPDAKTYESITGTPGSFRSVVRTLGRIVERQIPLRMALVLMPQNTHLEKDTREYLVNLGIPAAAISSDHVRPTGRGTGLANRATLAAAGRKAESAVVPLERLTGAPAGVLTPQEKGEFPWSRWQLPTAFPPRKDGRAGYQSCWDGELVIAADGVVYPCIFARSMPLGSILEMPLLTLVDGTAVQQVWGLNLSDSSECSRCEYRYGCFDCRALTLSITGSLHAKPPGCYYLPDAGVCDDQAQQKFSARKTDEIADLALKLREDLDWQDGNLFDPRSGSLYTVNEFGRAVAAGLDGKLRVAELAREAAAAFPEEDGEAVDGAVRRFVGDLAAAGLLIRVEPVV